MCMTKVTWYDLMTTVHFYRSREYQVCTTPLPVLDLYTNTLYTHYPWTLPWLLNVESVIEQPTWQVYTGNFAICSLAINSNLHCYIYWNDTRTLTRNSTDVYTYTISHPIDCLNLIQIGKSISSLGEINLIISHNYKSLLQPYNFSWL